MKVIEFHQVSKWYGQFQALKSISLTVNKGEIVVICGPSGSGKSTLIRTVNGLESIDSGEIIVLPELMNARDAAVRSAWCFSISTCFHI